MSGRIGRRVTTWVDDARGGLGAIFVEASVVVLILVIAIILSSIFLTVV